MLSASHLFNKWHLYWKSRWAFQAFWLVAFALRVVKTEAYYVIAYCLSTYLLNLLLLFLSPMHLPDEEEDSSDAIGTQSQLPASTGTKISWGSFVKSFVASGPANPTNEPTSILPMRSSELQILDTEDEFRPFCRKLSEFQCWKRAVTATLFSLVGTFFPILDLPVYAPILVIYFLVLLVVTLKTEIAKMIKFQYLPWDATKRRYNSSR